MLKMADVQLSSLGIQPSLGLPASLRRTEEAGAEPLGWVDASRGAQRVNAARKLLGEGVWSLHNLLGSDDFNVTEERHTVTLNYAVEPDLKNLQRGAVTTVLARYPRAAHGNKPCRVTHCSMGQDSYITSASAARESLERHMVGVNAQTSMGVAREALHMQSATRGAELGSVYVRMWLAHLSIRTDRPLTVELDRASLKGGLQGVQPEGESDAARLLRGVRVNARGLSDTALALLKVGCGDLNSLVGLHPRAQRYKFPTAPLTLYGSVDGGTGQVYLHDPKLTAMAIVSLAHRYGQYDVCGEALRTALIMFGVSLAGRAMVLKCAAPDLHDDLHSDPAGATYPYERFSDLGEKRILSLALFLGRAWRQVFGHVLRASLLTVSATDVDAARDSILPNHRTMMRTAAKTHEAATSHFSSLVSSTHFVYDNYDGLWRESGIAHSLALGVVIDGSVLEEVTRPISVPQVTNTSPTDDPGTSDKVAETWGSLKLVDELIQACGETLSGSRKARVDNIGVSMNISTETMQLCGGNVIFSLLSVGSGVTFNRSESGFTMEPPVSAGTQTTNVSVTHDTPVAVTVARAKTAAEHTDLYNAIQGAYVPRGSLMAQRRVDVVPRSRVDVTGDSVAVRPGAEEKLLSHLVERGAVIQETSGSGLLCGARAVEAAMIASGGMSPGLDTITEVIRAALSEEERAKSHAAGVPVGENNFTADQLGRGVQMLGDYALVVIDENREPVSMYRHGPAGARPVVVHNRDGHWSGVGFGTGRVIAIDRSQRVRM